VVVRQRLRAGDVAVVAVVRIVERGVTLREIAGRRREEVATAERDAGHADDREQDNHRRCASATHGFHLTRRPRMLRSLRSEAPLEDSIPRHFWPRYCGGREDRAAVARSRRGALLSPRD